MKLRSVKNLYLAKQLILGGENKKAIQLINSVLISEGGSRAVLYPYNSLKENIIQLWGEAMCPKDIVTKLGLGEDGEDIVLCIIEEQTNYEGGKQ